MTARFLLLYGTPSDPAAFERHYREIHLPMAKRLPGLRSYTLGRDAAPVRGGEPYHLIAELEWDDLDALRAAFASPEGRACAEDVLNLAALATIHSMTYTADRV